MRGFVIALICGLAAVLAVLLIWRGGDAPGPQPAQPRSASAAEPVPSAPPALEVPAPSPAPMPEAPPPPPPVPMPRPPSTLPPASAAVAKAVLPAAPAPSAAVQSAFALSSDHRTLIQQTQLAAPDHERLEREQRDEAWASEFEQRIRRELARQGSAGDFDIVAVDCRATLCAIQAFSNGEGGQRKWVQAVDELYRESLADAFDSVNTAFPTEGSGRSPVLTFLHRRPAPAQR